MRVKRKMSNEASPELRWARAEVACIRLQEQYVPEGFEVVEIRSRAPYEVLVRHSESELKATGRSDDDCTIATRRAVANILELSKEGE